MQLAIGACAKPMPISLNLWLVAQKSMNEIVIVWVIYAESGMKELSNYNLQSTE